MNLRNHSAPVNLQKGFDIIGDSACLKILYLLERSGEKTFTEVKQELSLNPTTLSKKLKALTRSGLVSADRTHDHLRVYYSLANHQRPLKRLLDAFERLASDL